MMVEPAAPQSILILQSEMVSIGLGFLQFAREKLPEDAVPVFVRVVRKVMPLHNYKQNKVPLRNDGVDPVKMEKKGDRLMWVKPGGSTYEYFGLAEWNKLDTGQAKL